MSAPVHVHPEDIIDTNKLITLIDDNHDTILFKPTFNLFMSFLFPQGAPTTSIEFIGYVLQFSNPTQPIMYPLYSPLLGLDALRRQLCVITYLETPMLHGSALELPGYEVPVFAILLQAMETTIPHLNLWWVRGRTGLNTELHGVYHYDDVAHAHEPEVKVYLVAYPFGNYIPDVEPSTNGSTILQTMWIGSSVTTFNTPRSIVVNWQPRPRKRILAEHMLTKITQLPMLHNDVLALASPWVTQFMYDNRHMVFNSMDDPCVFSLGNFFGLAQREIIIDLLKMFMRPHAHVLPIELNGFATVLMHQVAKEFIYHMILRTTSTSCIRFTIADLEPGIFRTVANPPVDTLALAGSCCYQALLARLLSLFGANETIPDYPSAAQIHSELCKTAVLLLQQENDPHITQFRAELRKLCIIIVKVAHNTRYNLQYECASASSCDNAHTFDSYSCNIPHIKYNLSMRIQFPKILASPSKLAVAQPHPIPTTVGKGEGGRGAALPCGCTQAPTCENTYKTNFLGIEQNETALITWLQTEGRDMLPDSLLTTASVLFGWVDTHDIMALLDVSLREVTMQTQLQQEEDMSYVGFHSQGACLMEDRMLQAQMEISLFSNAIVNLCKYLETRNYPRTLASPKVLEAPLGPDDQFLCLPHSLKTWVDNVTYRAYMSMTFAEAKPLYINNNDSFKTKEQKTPEVLRSDIHILGLKKQCTQSEMDMLSEAISRISEFSDDVTSSGSAVTYVSLSIDDYVEDRFDDWVSTSYASSDVELL
ncbi:hypothetical protein EDB19DRAFT_1832235 [Suillus lakei]|nr:hypothetical protein EDB19DRAFT_1832235 [Suillus lakei]